MAQATGAHSTYDEASKGNREDLSDIIEDVSPTDTPLYALMGKKKAKATTHEWLTDSLAAAAANAQVEGDDASPADATARTRMSNYTQILRKAAVVTGTQEAVDKAGVDSEMAYQVARRMKEMKRDMEYAFIGAAAGNAKVAGNDSTAREMGSLDAYVITNGSLAASGSSAAAGNGGTPSDYAGTDRALDETIFKDALQDIFTNSGGSSSLTCITTAASKGVISTFTASSTRHVTTDDKKLVASIDVYVGDFHTVKIIADRYCATGHTYIVDPEYISLAELRPLFSFDLATLGDSKRKQLVWEATLEVGNEKAHAHIGDLTT
jgi:hypothetical protein